MSTPSQAEVRRMIAAAGTIVVKVGSSSLTQPSGHLDPDKLDALAAALAQVRWTWPLSRPPQPSAKGY